MLAEIRQNVREAVRARRSLWRLLKNSPKNIVVNNSIRLDPEIVHGWLDGIPGSVLNGERLRETLRSWRHADSSAVIFPDLLFTHTYLDAAQVTQRDSEFAQQFGLALPLSSTYQEKQRSDAAYLTWLNLRRAYEEVRPSVESCTPFFVRLCSELRARRASGDTVVDFIRGFWNDEANNQDMRSLFVEACFSTESFEHSSANNTLSLPDAWLEPEYLISRLFGIRTGISNFDLLAPGGMRLADSYEATRNGGRIILIRGSYGAGKSILALSLAAEVARKGGLSTLVPLEDSLASLRNYAATLGIMDGGLRPAELDWLPSADPTTELSGIAASIDHESSQPPSSTAFELEPQNGGLTIMGPPSGMGTVADILQRISKHVEIEKNFNYPIRLLVLDTISSLSNVHRDRGKLRASLMQTIEQVKQSGSNLILTAELDDSHIWSDILAYVADYVIELSASRHHEQDERHIEITKSRFQRQRSGRHPFAIIPGRGVVVYPNSRAILAEQAELRQLEGQERPIVPVGWQDLDRVLGSGAFRKGDVALIRGVPGTFKTRIAKHFLQAQPNLRENSVSETGEEETSTKPRVRSLILTVDAARLGYEMAHFDVGTDARVPIDVGVLSAGMAQPGVVLSELRALFTEACSRGIHYDRVIICNTERWLLNCPLIADDPTFPGALLGILRRQHVTTVLVCGASRQEIGSYLARVFAEEASVLIETERVEFRGAQTVLMRALRTAEMNHSREWHYITVEESTSGAKATERKRLRLDLSLLRLSDTADSGRPFVYEVETHLYLYEVDVALREYNESIRAKLESVLTSTIRVISGDRAMLREAAELAPHSVGSHLQIVQIDEFQLPALDGRQGHRCMLRGFEPDSPDVTQSNGSALVFAYPYYKNIGLMTVRPEAMAIIKHDVDSATSNWKAIAEAARAWGNSRRDSAWPELFFDFRKQAGEDYNCLFFEIALSLFPSDKDFPETSIWMIDRDQSTSVNEQSLESWLREAASLGAFDIFQQVCALAHRKARTQPRKWISENEPVPVTDGPLDAVVTRQWFTTLRGAMRGRDPRDWSAFELRPLPGNVALAGDWYLGVLAHSAVPEAGKKIIQVLTSREYEFDRLRRGIGLPVSPEFYGEGNRLFPYPARLAEDFGNILTSPKRRSNIAKYHLFSPILSSYLRELLEQDVEVESTKSTVDRLIANMRAVYAATR